MLNCEKTFLVMYIDVTRFNDVDKKKYLNEIIDINNKLLKNTSEINDDSVIPLVIPCDRTEVKLLNAIYPNYEDIKILAEQQLEELKKIHKSQ